MDKKLLIGLIGGLIVSGILIGILIGINNKQNSADSVVAEAIDGSKTTVENSMDGTLNSDEDLSLNNKQDKVSKKMANSETESREYNESQKTDKETKSVNESNDDSVVTEKKAPGKSDLKDEKSEVEKVSEKVKYDIADNNLSTNEISNEPATERMQENATVSDRDSDSNIYVEDVINDYSDNSNGYLFSEERPASRSTINMTNDSNNDVTMRPNVENDEEKEHLVIPPTEEEELVETPAAELDDDNNIDEGAGDSSSVGHIDSNVNDFEMGRYETFRVKVR